MATYSKFWKVWLRPNPLTQNVDNDYIAEVKTSKYPVRNEDIARRIIAEGSEIKYETLLSVFNQRDRIVRDALADGCNVITGVCRFSPRVSGAWTGGSMQFDPQQHRLTLDVMPSTEMRLTLDKVGVEVLAVKTNGGAYIGAVTDLFTGLKNNTVTIGDDLLIEGYKIKVEGEDERIGVYFVDADGSETKVLRRITRNTFRTLIARVPDTLTPGTYTLRVVTQYTGGASPLKQPRTLEYLYPLQLIAGE